MPPSEASDSRSSRLAGCRDRTCVGKHGEIKHTRAAQRPAPQPGRNQLARPASVRTCRRVSGCSSLAVAARGGPSRPASREGRPPELPPAAGAAGAVPRAPAAGAELAAARVGAAAAAAAGLTAATLGAEPAAAAGAARGGCTAACCTCRCCGCCCESGEPKSTVMDAGCCGCGGCTPPLAAAAAVRRWAGSLLCRRHDRVELMDLPAWRGHAHVHMTGPQLVPCLHPPRLSTHLVVPERAQRALGAAALQEVEAVLLGLLLPHVDAADLALRQVGCRQRWSYELWAQTCCSLQSTIAQAGRAGQMSPAVSPHRVVSEGAQAASVACSTQEVRAVHKAPCVHRLHVRAVSSSVCAGRVAGPGSQQSAGQYKPPTALTFLVSSSPMLPPNTHPHLQEGLELPCVWQSASEHRSRCCSVP